MSHNSGCMKRFLFVAFIFFAIEVAAQSNDETAVRKILSDQSAAWNRGDIEGFMKGYWENDSLMFIGQNGITYGWSNTVNNYKKNYPDAAAMGKLSFTIISVKNLSAEYFHVTGKWHLQRTMDHPEGYFTLLFRKIKGQWFIIADHSS
jgi:ketosteroid isomerase-like protein